MRFVMLSCPSLRPPSFAATQNLFARAIGSAVGQLDFAMDSRARMWPGVTVQHLRGCLRGYMDKVGEVDLYAALKVVFSDPV
jgi:hypothetical protein